MSKIIKKHQYLLENGWWCHYTPNHWYEKSKDKPWVNIKGNIVGFRPKSEGISLGEAYRKAKL
jgi:hypothetical protein